MCPPTQHVGKEPEWSTVRVGEVGKILMSRSALADKLVGGSGDAESFRLHSGRAADEQLLTDLMSRYGEDFNEQLWSPFKAEPAWAKDELRQDGEESAGTGNTSIFDGYPDAVEAEDRVQLEQWVTRRSAEDVVAFKAWFNDRYQRDPGTGIRVLEWELQDLQDDGEAEAAPVQPPHEWSRVEELERISPALEKQEVTVYTAEDKFRRLVEARFGLKDVRVRQVESLLAAGFLASLLVAAPAFVATWVHRSEPALSARPAAPPEGVDAYLIQTDFSSDRYVLNGLLNDCDHVIPKLIKSCKPKSTKELPPEVLPAPSAHADPARAHTRSAAGQRSSPGRSARGVCGGRRARRSRCCSRAG
jgi:hypothetical protein